MSVPINTEQQKWFQDVQDLDGQPITGSVSWSFTGSKDPNGDAWSPDSWTEDADVPGDWLRTHTYDVTGAWKFRATPDGESLNAVTDEFTVTDPASDAQTIAQAVLAASVTGGAAGSVAAKLNEIGTTTVDATVPIEANPATIPVIRGDTYSNTIGTAIDFTSDDWPDLTAATVTMEIATINGTSLSLPMTVVTPTGTAEVRLEMTNATTAAFPVFVGRYEVVATLAGPATATLASGTFYAKD